jgi:RNA polymerase sigma factor (TIGR02999 family)
VGVPWVLDACNADIEARRSAMPTQALLQRLRAGEPGACAELFEAAYDALTRLARAHLRTAGWPAELDCTAVVHETYLRLAEARALQPQDLRAFLAYASRVMRSVIVDALRERNAQCRGGGQDTMALDENVEEVAQDAGEGRLHDALLALEADAPRLARLVALRYFGGYSEQEIARALAVTDRTLRRDWERARAMLRLALR